MIKRFEASKVWSKVSHHTGCYQHHGKKSLATKHKGGHEPFLSKKWSFYKKKVESNMGNWQSHSKKANVCVLEADRL